MTRGVRWRHGFIVVIVPLFHVGAASLGRTGGGQGCKDDNNNDSENDNSVDAAFVGAIGVLPIVAIADKSSRRRPRRRSGAKSAHGEVMSKYFNELKKTNLEIMGTEILRRKAPSFVQNWVSTVDTPQNSHHPAGLVQCAYQVAHTSD